MRNYDYSGTEQKKLTKALMEIRQLGYYVSKTLLDDDWKEKKNQEEVLKANNAEDKYFLQWMGSNIYQEGYANWFLEGNLVEVARILKNNGIMVISNGHTKGTPMITVFNSKIIYEKAVEKNIINYNDEYKSHQIEEDVHNFILTNEEVYNCLFNDKGDIGEIIEKYFEYYPALKVIHRIDSKYFNSNTYNNDFFNLKCFYNINIRRVKIEALKQAIEDRKTGNVTVKRTIKPRIIPLEKFNYKNKVENVWSYSEEEVLGTYYSVKVIKCTGRVYLTSVDYGSSYWDITDEYVPGEKYLQKLFIEKVLGTKSEEETKRSAFLNDIFKNNY